MTRHLPPITRLAARRWRGHQILFEYTTRFYYDLSISLCGEKTVATLERKAFPVPLAKQFPTDLFNTHWEHVRAYGIVHNDQLLAVAETAIETWSNRLRLTNLWVHKNCRRQGIARQLMYGVKQRAEKEKNRAIILEVQSCNTPAIDLYRSEGFQFIGFNTCDYSNDDLAKKEVRLEMAILL